MAPARPTILVVDDDAATRELLTALLTEAGYTVQTASDAESALRMLLAKPPHLMMLDYALPRKSGRDLLRLIRMSGIPCPPVIVVSASIHAERCLEDGATAFLRKPFELDVLYACVARYVAKKRTEPLLATR
jgi:CheY-like chemotaxis protein